VWTPDTRRSMRRLLDMGVDSITTNRVGVLCGLRKDG
jgi:glycerophosphoryl diester phosphodiesterase